MPSHLLPNFRGCWDRKIKVNEHNQFKKPVGLGQSLKKKKLSEAFHKK